LRDDRKRFEEMGQVALIGLGTPERAAWFCREKRLNGFACLAGDGTQAHRAWGLKRGTMRQLLGPSVYRTWKSLAVLPDTRFAHPGEDWTQLPGTFVIDTGGIVRYAHRNRDVADNPPNQEVLAALEQAAEAKPRRPARRAAR
jgi:peroxiredoxin